MKLHNQSLIYLTFAFFVIIGVWSFVFYIDLKDEIRDSIDDGLDNNRLLLLQQIEKDSSLLQQEDFGGNNFSVKQISRKNALAQKDVLKDTMMYRLNEDDLEPVRILHTSFGHQGKYYHLKIISSLVEEDDLIEDAFYNILLLFIVLVLSTFIINNFVLKRLWNPFYDLLGQISRYKLDKDAHAIKSKTNTKEFLALQKAANKLLLHSKETYRAQKEFTENAAHELQTPLAIMANKLELLLESENLNAAQSKQIAEILQTLNRLNHLNKALLLLAKIENKQYNQEEAITINKVIDKVLNDFEDFISYKNLAVKRDYEQDITWHLDKHLAYVLCSNLIKNALFHSSENAEICIQSKQDKLSICNTGSAKALDASVIFNRFTKGANQPKSTGIGLAVAKAICDYYTLQLTYTYLPEKNWHCFEISRAQV
ncbi:sensor histidine kinase [Haloflavibacter putidus]|uniref:histidine kinase n=1 Tax=Haloflavibacter putidus TaxID=2576776 RepID=A0A508A423_9FLAO|nr:HAMP domain-containing sensor histidine kinase [Haloflavibacter putidus]TQD40612.1 HAMP domain-containing histidine kinase [Haloflavibacter putidus]